MSTPEPQASSPSLRGYAVAVLAVAAALSLCLLLRPYLEPNYFPLFLGAVVVAAGYGGLGPGLLAGVLSLGLSAYLFLAPGYPVGAKVGSDLLRLGTFAAAAYLVSWASGRLRTALEAAREGEERFRATFEQAAAGIAHLTPDGRWLRVNRRLCEIVGYDHEELLGLSLQDITHPADLDADLEQAEQLATGAIDSYSMEKRYLHKDGSVVWIELTGSAVRAPSGELRYFLAVVQDISERKRLQEEQRFLAEATRILTSSLDYEATLAALIRLAVPTLADYCSVDVVSPGGEIRRVGCSHVDPEKERLLHELWERYPYTWEDRTGAPEVLRTGAPLLAPVIEDGAVEEFAHDEERLRMMRAVHPRSYICVPLRARGRVLGALSFVISDSARRYDEHDLRRAEELAARAAVAIDNARLYEGSVEANRAKTDFMATMSHELRTPLNAVIGYADLLLLGVPAPLTELQTRQAERIQDAARHLLALIEEILTFSGLEAGREEVWLERAGASEIVREAMARVEPRAAEKGVELRVEVAAPAPVLETDPEKARQILLNLLGNAVKFTDRGEVALRVEERDGEVRFVVRDTGIGIAEEHHERIFDSFWQVDQSRSREAGGTGLGLTVARRMARLLGGDVTVASVPGEGSTFTLSLPVRAARAKRAG